MKEIEQRIIEKQDELIELYDKFISEVSVTLILHQGELSKEFNEKRIPLKLELSRLKDKANQREKLIELINLPEGESNGKVPFDLASHPDTEADGIVFCGKCGKMK